MLCGKKEKLLITGGKWHTQLPLSCKGLNHQTHGLSLPCLIYQVSLIYILFFLVRIITYYGSLIIDFLNPPFNLLILFSSVFHSLSFLSAFFSHFFLCLVSSFHSFHISSHQYPNSSFIPLPLLPSFYSVSLPSILSTPLSSFYFFCGPFFLCRYISSCGQQFRSGWLNTDPLPPTLITNINTLIRSENKSKLCLQLSLQADGSSLKYEAE